MSVPVWIGKPVTDEEASFSSDDSDDDEETPKSGYERNAPTAVAYFIITALSYEPLVSLEEDFRSSVSSKARAGELGCWVDIGDNGATKMVLTGVERARVRGRERDRPWHGIRESACS